MKAHAQALFPRFATAHPKRNEDVFAAKSNQALLRLFIGADGRPLPHRGLFFPLPIPQPRPVAHLEALAGHPASHGGNLGPSRHRSKGAETETPFDPGPEKAGSFPDVKCYPKFGPPGKRGSSGNRRGSEHGQMDGEGESQYRPRGAQRRADGDGRLPNPPGFRSRRRSSWKTPTWSLGQPVKNERPASRSWSGGSGRWPWSWSSKKASTISRQRKGGNW